MEHAQLWLQPLILLTAFIFFWREAKGKPARTEGGYPKRTQQDRREIQPIRRQYMGTI